MVLYYPIMEEYQLKFTSVFVTIFVLFSYFSLVSNNLIVSSPGREYIPLQKVGSCLALQPVFTHVFNPPLSTLIRVISYKPSLINNSLHCPLVLSCTPCIVPRIHGNPFLGGESRGEEEPVDRGTRTKN